MHLSVRTNNIQAVATAAAELRYEQASSAMELLAKDEAMRKLRVRNMLLGHELDDMSEKLDEEFERGDTAESDAQNWRANAEEVTERLDRALNDLRSRTRELELLKVITEHFIHSIAPANMVLARLSSHRFMTRPPTQPNFLPRNWLSHENSHN